MNNPFSRSAALLGENTMQRISNAKVLVVGIGGVGSWCAEALARTGFPRITMADCDCIDITNTNRQVHALNETIGMSKPDAMSGRLKKINPNGCFTPMTLRFSTETAESFNLASFDFVVDAIDSVADKASLILAALNAERPLLLSSMGAALRFDPSRIKSTPFKKVAGDGLARALRSRFKKLERFPDRDFTCVWSDEPPAECDVRASLMPVTAGFGLKLASLVIDACRTPR